jgi:hypothetical protein
LRQTRRMIAWRHFLGPSPHPGRRRAFSSAPP